MMMLDCEAFKWSDIYTADVQSAQYMCKGRKRKQGRVKIDEAEAYVTDAL